MAYWLVTNFIQQTNETLSDLLSLKKLDNFLSHLTLRTHFHQNVCTLRTYVDKSMANPSNADYSSSLHFTSPPPPPPLNIVVMEINRVLVSLSYQEKTGINSQNFYLKSLFFSVYKFFHMTTNFPVKKVCFVKRMVHRGLY